MASELTVQAWFDCPAAHRVITVHVVQAVLPAVEAKLTPSVQMTHAEAPCAEV